MARFSHPRLLPYALLVALAGLPRPPPAWAVPSGGATARGAGVGSALLVHPDVGVPAMARGIVPVSWREFGKQLARRLQWDVNQTRDAISMHVMALSQFCTQLGRGLNASLVLGIDWPKDLPWRCADLQRPLEKIPTRLFYNSSSLALAEFPSSHLATQRKARKVQKRVLRLLGRKTEEEIGMTDRPVMAQMAWKHRCRPPFKSSPEPPCGSSRASPGAGEADAPLMSTWSRMSSARFGKEEEMSSVGPGSYEIPTTMDEHAVSIANGERFVERECSENGAGFYVFDELSEKKSVEKRKSQGRALSAAAKENRAPSSTPRPEKNLAERFYSNGRGAGGVRTAATPLTRRGKAKSPGGGTGVRCGGGEKGDAANPNVAKYLEEMLHLVVPGWARPRQMIGKEATELKLYGTTGEPCLFKHVSPRDIQQGYLGDCWLVSSFSALAEYPDRVRSLFKQKSLSADGRD
eukprot:g25674.t1